MRTVWASTGWAKRGRLVLETPEMPGVTRKYTAIQQVQDEEGVSRIWAGVHFRNSIEVADDMGRRIGEFVLTNYLH